VRVLGLVSRASIVASETRYAQCSRYVDDVAVMLNNIKNL